MARVGNQSGIPGGGTVTSVDGIDSVQANPSPITGTGTLQLVNDQLAPGNNYYYGTDGTGVKGFFPVPQGGAIVPITEAALVALIGSLDPTVIYLVTDAGSVSGQLSAPYAQIYVRAFDASNLNPECNGQFQNSVMSTPVLFSGQYTLDGGQPYIAQVQTTTLNNKWSVQKNNPNFTVDRVSLDQIRFDITGVYDNTFENFGMLNSTATETFESCTFKNMSIDFNSNTGTSFIHHWQEGHYSTDILLAGNNCYFQYNTLHFQVIVNMGSTCGVVGCTVNDGAFGIWNFNAGSNCYIDFCDFGFNNSIQFGGSNAFVAESIFGEANNLTVRFQVIRSTFDCNANVNDNGFAIDLCDFGSQSFVAGNGNMLGSTFRQDSDVENNSDITFSQFQEDCVVFANGVINESIFEPTSDVENNVGLNGSTFKLGCFVHDNQSSIISSTFEQGCEVSNHAQAIIQCTFEKGCTVHDNQQALIESNFGQDSIVNDNIGLMISVNIEQEAFVHDNQDFIGDTNIYQEAELGNTGGAVLSTNIYQGATVVNNTNAIIDSNIHAEASVSSNGAIVDTDIFQSTVITNFSSLIQAIFEKDCFVNGNGFTFVDTYVGQDKTFTALASHSVCQWDLETSNFDITLDVTGIGTNNGGDGTLDMDDIGIGTFNTGTVVGVIAQGSTVTDGGGNSAIVMGIDYFTGAITFRSLSGVFVPTITLDDGSGNTVSLQAVTYGSAWYLGKIKLHSDNATETITKWGNLGNLDHDVEFSFDNLNQMTFISKNPATVTQSEFNLKNGANVTLQGYNGFSDFIVLRRAFNAGGGIEFSREINNSIL